MPNSFKEDFTVGQASCMYFSAQSNRKTRNLKSAKYPKKKYKTKMNQLLMKRIKYEIRPGEPNGSMSMGQKKVEPILCVESLIK